MSLFPIVLICTQWLRTPILYACHLYLLGFRNISYLVRSKVSVSSMNTILLAEGLLCVLYKCTKCSARRKNAKKYLLKSTGIYRKRYTTRHHNLELLRCSCAIQRQLWSLWPRVCTNGHRLGTTCANIGFVVALYTSIVAASKCGLVVYQISPRYSALDLPISSDTEKSWMRHNSGSWISWPWLCSGTGYGHCWLEKESRHRNCVIEHTGSR